ncbi:uncharacterized protein TNCV_646171 [Trichonephila clavipes]|nr:uncharacterized protein TNCV_646171 [Trichonephila clavipes]
MTSSNSCKGSQEPFCNKTMLGLTRQGFLRTVTTLPWPDRSSDLSQIEHIWDHLGQRVGHPTSLNELGARLPQIWNQIVSRHHTELVFSRMPDHITSCIRAKRVQKGFKSSILLPFSLK